MNLAGDIMLLVGAIFTCLGALGLLRMPDVFNRLQAGTKAVTLGALGILIGVGLEHPQWWANLLIIAVIILFTNPVGSSSIARASLIAGIKPWRLGDKSTPTE